MKYLVRKSIVSIYGKIWMPCAPVAVDRELSHYDVENARGDDGRITRESVEGWLSRNAGDFSQVLDFSASIEDGNDTVNIPWDSEENELAYLDCLYPPESEDGAE